MLETVRAVIPMMPYAPSVAVTRLTKGGGSSVEGLVFTDEHGREII